MFSLERLFYTIPAILIGLTVHEFSHAYSAFKLGDTTARDQGRITLNPLKHIDILGFIFIIIAGFGWAKPVQFSPAHLKNPKRDRGIIALAGPLSNLLLGLVCALICKLMYTFKPADFGIYYTRLYLVFLYAVYINFGLAVFNILPIPPLDGSHIFFSGLNLSPETEMKISRIGFPLLFIIIIIQNRTNITILPIGQIVESMVSFILD